MIGYVVDNLSLDVYQTALDDSVWIDRLYGGKDARRTIYDKCYYLVSEGMSEYP